MTDEIESMYGRTAALDITYHRAMDILTPAGFAFETYMTTSRKQRGSDCNLILPCDCVMVVRNEVTPALGAPWESVGLDAVARAAVLQLGVHVSVQHQEKLPQPLWKSRCPLFDYGKPTTLQDTSYVTSG